MPKFFTKAGFLTFYAMACGYLHQTKRDDGATVRLSLNNAETNVFEVEIWDGLPSEQKYEFIEGIAEARKLYKKACNGRIEKRNRKSYENEDVPSVVYA